MQRSRPSGGRLRGRQGQYRRAWVITSVIGVALLIVSAIVFTISTGTQRITTHAEALHLSDEALRVATAARAQVGFANHLAGVKRKFSSNVTSEIETSTLQATQALDALDEGLATLDEVGGRVTDEMWRRNEEFQSISREVLDLVAAVVAEAPNADQLGEQANDLSATQLDAAYRDLFESVARERDYQLQQVVSSDALMARLGDVARFLVALLIPLAVIVIYREVVRRQQRQAELEVRLDAEREVGKARDDFVANASHEFRTPLTSIYGLAQLIEEDPDVPDQTREMAEMISTEAADLSRMVEDLLTTARLEAGALTFQRENVMTHEEVDDIVRPFRRNGRAIETDVRAAVVRVDRLRQRQVLRNLISNAAKYGGDEITVSGAKDGDWFEWIVADNGEGIPAELEAKLFERFMHQGTKVIVPGGVGLGLSIVKALVEGMGGSVSYRRRAGKTEFVVRVPMAVSTAKRPAASAAPTRRAGSFEVAASTPYDGADRRT